MATWKKVITSGDTGLLTTGTQTISGAKTFSAALTAGTINNTSIWTANIYNNSSSNNGSIVLSSSPNAITMKTGTTTALTLNASQDAIFTGNVGVGINPTTYPFQVDGHMRLESNGRLFLGAGGAIADSGSNTWFIIPKDGANKMLFKTANVTALSIDSSQNATFAGTVNATTFVGALTGNASGSSATCSGLAGSATVLATARTIAGVSFNGSANISLNNNAITNGAGYTTNTGDITSVTAGTGMSGGGTSGSVTLTNASPNIVYPAETKSTINALDITEVGIISSGEWRGTTVDPSSGGTGLTSISTLLNSNVTRDSLGLGTTDDPTFDDVAVNKLGFSGQGSGVWSNSNGIGNGDVGLGQNSDSVSLDIGDQGGFSGKVYIHTDGNLNFTFDQHNTSSVPLQVTSLGVGTAASGTTGEIRATNEVTAFYSDDRLKTKSGNIKNALDKVVSLNGFHYKPNKLAGKLGYDTSVKKVGVSAQEVLKVLPEAVVPAPIDPKYHTVQYNKLIPLLIESIKELTAKVTRLEDGNS